MSRHDPTASMQQILSNAKEAVKLSQGKSRADLEDDQLLNLAMTRLLEIIGEAAKRVPEEVQGKYPDLPWQQMIGLRNRLIHGYDQVDFDILWVIVSLDLPLLISQLEMILQDND